MGALNKIMDIFGGLSSNEEYEEDLYEEVEERGAYEDQEDIYSSRSSRSKVIPMSSVMPANKMIITQPNSFEDVQEIAESFKARRSVIINLESVNKEQGRRILDFMYGTAFAVDGTVQKISNLIYIVTPKNVEVQSTVETSNYKSKSSFSWLK